MRCAAGSTDVDTQRLTWGIIGQRRYATGRKATRPPSAAASSNGRSAPHTLGPPSESLVLMKGLSWTTPEARQARSSVSRQGSSLVTKYCPLLPPQAESTVLRMPSTTQERTDGMAGR